MRLARAAGALVGTLPNLKLIVNLGAGVDRLFADPKLPNVPIMRASHPDLSMRVTEYVVLHTLRYHRRQPLYDAQQRDRVWREHAQPAASEVAVGVMGLGAIGSEAARVLARIGFQRGGLERDAKADRRHRMLSRAGGLDRVSRANRNSDLPLAADRSDARDPQSSTCSRSSSAMVLLGGAFLINAGRGSLQIDADILARAR